MGGQPAYREPRRASVYPCRGCRVPPAPDRAGLPVRSDRPSPKLCPICTGRRRRTTARLSAPAPPLRPDRPSRVCRKPCGRRRWIPLWGGSVCIVSTARPPLPSPRPSPSDPARGRERGAFRRSASLWVEAESAGAGCVGLGRAGRRIFACASSGRALSGYTFPPPRPEGRWRRGQDSESALALTPCLVPGSPGRPISAIWRAL